MPSIWGKITKRLIEQLGKKDPGWFPERGEVSHKPLPKNVQGKSLGKRGKKSK